MDEKLQELNRLMENAYLVGETPWNQSGFSGSEDRWNRLRRPLAEGVGRSGSFLDIGCANGYLLECLLRWCGEKGLTIVPYGLDVSAPLVALAQERLAQDAAHFIVGDAFTWQPPQRFDFVSTDVVYVAEEQREAYLKRILQDFLTDDGTLLISEYRSTKQSELGLPFANEYIEQWSLPVYAVHSGWDLNGKELTRVTIVKKAACGNNGE